MVEGMVGVLGNEIDYVVVNVMVDGVDDVGAAVVDELLDVLLCELVVAVVIR